jgi:glutamate 5-kinase
VAAETGADLLVLLTDIDGLYTSDPRRNSDASLIKEVYEIHDDILRFAGETRSSLGTGGMHTKLGAARICMENGFDMIIANGADPRVLYKIADGEDVGTRFFGREKQ